jgi:hypothetical protein
MSHELSVYKLEYQVPSEMSYACVVSILYDWLSPFKPTQMVSNDPIPAVQCIRYFRTLLLLVPVVVRKELLLLETNFVLKKSVSGTGTATGPDFIVSLIAKQQQFVSRKVIHWYSVQY